MSDTEKFYPASGITYTADPAAPPKVEMWTEVRCPACRPLGYAGKDYPPFNVPMLLFKVYGITKADGAIMQIRCTRCKSIVAWLYGTPKIDIIKSGRPRFARKVVFE